jgi:hypothetical protein
VYETQGGRGGASVRRWMDLWIRSGLATAEETSASAVKADVMLIFMMILDELIFLEMKNVETDFE